MNETYNIIWKNPRNDSIWYLAGFSATCPIWVRSEGEAQLFTRNIARQFETLLRWSEDGRGHAYFAVNTED